MERDKILEGFIAAGKIHGVRYKKFIGDEESSVYPTHVTLNKLNVQTMHESATGQVWKNKHQKLLLQR